MPIPPPPIPMIARLGKKADHVARWFNRHADQFTGPKWAAKVAFFKDDENIRKALLAFDAVGVRPSAESWQELQDCEKTVLEWIDDAVDLTVLELEARMLLLAADAVGHERGSPPDVKFRESMDELVRIRMLVEAARDAAKAAEEESKKPADNR